MPEKKVELSVEEMAQASGGLHLSSGGVGHRGNVDRGEDPMWVIHDSGTVRKPSTESDSNRT